MIIRFDLETDVEVDPIPTVGNVDPIPVSNEVYPEKHTVEKHVTRFGRVSKPPVRYTS